MTNCTILMKMADFSKALLNNPFATTKVGNKTKCRRITVAFPCVNATDTYQLLVICIEHYTDAHHFKNCDTNLFAI